MKLKLLIDYIGRETNEQLVKAGSTIELDRDEAQAIITGGFVEVVDEEPQPDEKVKGGRHDRKSN